MGASPGAATAPDEQLGSEGDGQGLGHGDGADVRLLLVAETVPNRDPRSGDGSSMISFELVTRLPDDVEVDLLTYESGIPVPAEVAARCASVRVLPRRGRMHALLRSAFSAWEVGACERSTAEAGRQVAALSEAADVTLLHGPHVASLAASVRGPAALQVVDPWSARTRMEAAMARGARRRFLLLRARRLERKEQALPPGLRLLTVGQQDAAAWQVVLGRDVQGVPNGVAAVAASGIDRAPVPTACFAGTLDYPPNIDSARRLVRAVAPRVWEHIPEAHFVLVGRRPGPEVRALIGSQVELRGDVASLPDEFARAHVAVFADRFGVGVRNTVREALAAGVPVVATPMAARGLPALDGLMVRATDEELAAAIIQILRRAQDEPGDAGPSRRAGPSWEQMVGRYLTVLQAAGQRSVPSQEGAG